MYKEYTRPLEQSIDADKNVFSVLEERVRRAPNDSLVEYKNEAGEWSSFSAAEFQAKVIAIAKGLIARGIMPGDSVSITAHTCWQWTALDLAIMSIGALTVPVYETNSPAQVTMIFNDSKVKMAFAEDDGQRDKIESVPSSNTAAPYPMRNSMNANMPSKVPTWRPSYILPVPRERPKALSSPTRTSCSSPIPVSIPCLTSP